MVDRGRANTAEPQPTGRRRRRDRSRGAVLVEAAIIFPVLALLTFGAIEFGFVFHDELILTTAARSGARIGTTDKNTAGTAVNADDDYQILQAVYSALGGLSNKVVSVTVYDAGASGNGPPAACVGAGATSNSALKCDVFPQSDLSQPQSYWTGSTPTEENPWSYADRSVDLNTSNNQEPTYLGVAVTTTHNYLTGLFGSSRTLTEYAVFRFEPTNNTGRSHLVVQPPPTTTTTAGPTTTAAPTTTGAPTTTLPTTTTTHAPTTTGAPTTTHAPTTSTTAGPTTTHAPTTTSAPTTAPPPTTSTTAPVGIPT